MNCHVGGFHSGFRSKRMVFQNQVPEGQNPLERLEAKINKKEAVTKDQVSAGYNDQVDNLRKTFVAGGGDAANFETEKKAELDALAQKRDKMIEDAAKLQQELDKGKTETKTVARKRRREVATDVETGPAAARKKKGKETGKLKPTENVPGPEQDPEVKAREERFSAAVREKWNLTDPSKDGAAIPDYEGVGDRDTHSHGRRVLTGYLAGLQMQDSALAKKAWEDAKQEYNISSTGDMALNDEPMEKNVVQEKYWDQVKDLPLAEQTKGFVAALLRLSDEYLQTPEERKVYTDYLLKTINGTNFDAAEIKTKYFDKVQEHAWYAVFSRLKSSSREINAEEDKANMEMNALSGIETPKDWRDRLAGLLLSFQGSVKKFTDLGLGFTFKSPDLNALNERTADQGVGDLTEGALQDASEAARAEIIGFLHEKKIAAGKDIEDVGKKKEDLMKRAAGERYVSYTDEDWAKVDKALTQSGTDLDAIKTDSNLSLEEAATEGEAFGGVLDGVDMVEDNLDEKERAILESKDKKTAVDAFLKEKELKEVVEGTTYKYGPDNPGSQYGYGTTFEGTKCTFNYLNKDVQDRFGAKVNAYLQKELDNALTQEQAAKYVQMMSEAKASKNPQKEAEASRYVNECFLRNRKKDEVDKIAFVQGLGETAMGASTMEYNHPPERPELEKTYAENFLPAWEKAGSDLDTHVSEAAAATPNVPVPTVPDVPTTPTAPTAPEKPTPNADAFSEDWEKGKDVDLPDNLKGYRGGFEVIGIEGGNGLTLRDLSTHRLLTDQTLALGTGKGSATEITLADPDGKAQAHEVNSVLFVRVKYQGHEYWAKNDRMKQNEAPAPKAAPGEMPDEVVEAIYKNAVGLTMRDYLEGVKMHGVGGEKKEGGTSKETHWEYLPVTLENAEKGIVQSLIDKFTVPATPPAKPAPFDFNTVHHRADSADINALQKQLGAIDFSKIKKRIEVPYDGVTVVLDPSNKEKPAEIKGLKEWMAAREAAKEKAEKAMKDVVTDVLSHFKGIKTSPAALQDNLNKRLLDAYKTKGEFGPENYYVEQTVDGVNVRLISRAGESGADKAGNQFTKGDPMFTYTGLVQWVEKNGK